MASLMQDWLLWFVKQQLEKAIDWKKSEAYDTDGRSSDYNFVKDEEQIKSNHSIARRSITDDGSNLRVSIDLSPGCEHAVQIVKYLEYEHPVKAVISDSHTSIVTKFSKAATDIYERNNHGRRITKITSGGIISIRRCEIVATTYGPESERLSLLITEFRYRGCGGSQTFGRPKPIEEKPEMEHCIKDMIEAKDTKAYNKQKRQSGEASNSEEAISEEDDKNTVFQTQASHISDQQHYNSQFVSTMREEGHEAEKILGVNSDGPRAPVAAMVAKEISGRFVDTEDKITKYNKDQKETSSTACANAAGNEAIEISVIELARKDTKPDGKFSKNINRKSSGKSSKLMPGQMSMDESPKYIGEALEVPEWMPLRAITRRSCLVPADQMKLLSRRESWMPSEPGIQFPLANIPIKILDELKNSRKKQIKRKYQSGVFTANGNTRQNEKPEDNFDSRSNESYLMESEHSSSGELSWAATNSDLAHGELPPDSSFLQDQLSASLRSSQSQQYVSKAAKKASDQKTAKNSMSSDDPSKEWPRNQSDEESGLEMCLPGELQAQAGQSLDKLYSDAKSRSYKEKQTLNYGSQSDETNHFSLQSGTHPHLRAETQNRGVLGLETLTSKNPSKHNFPKAISTTIVPNTPSRSVNHLQSLSRRQFSDDDKVHKSSIDPTLSSPVSERQTHMKKNTIMSQAEVLDDNKAAPSTFVNNTSQRPETREREYGNGNYYLSPGRKKLKIQHSENEPFQNSPAFLESACQAQEAKRDFLHMLAATKMASGATDTALTSSVATDQPVGNLSQSSPKHIGGPLTDLDATISREYASAQPLDGSLQSQNSAEVSKSALVPSRSQRSSIDYNAPAVVSKLSAGIRSVVASQEMSSGSARTYPTSPMVNNVVYVTFREVYSDYTGDLKHFLGICKLIDSSQQTGTAQHRSLWDDFIVKHITDYGPYLLSCNAAGERPISYEQYYRDRVDEPCHNKRILTPESLREALDLNSRASSANAIGHSKFQSFNDSIIRGVNGSSASSRRRNGKKRGYMSSSPTSIQWKREGHRTSGAKVNSNAGNSTHTSPRRGKKGNLQNSPQLAIRGGANFSFERRGSFQGYNNSTAMSPNSPQSQKHVSTNSTIPFASSPLGGNSVAQGSGTSRLDRIPSSERSWKRDQDRPSKPIPAPLHSIEISTKTHSLSSLPLPLSSSSSTNCLPLLGSSLHGQAESNNDGDANVIKTSALQHNAEYDRGPLRRIYKTSNSSVQNSNPPLTLPAVVTCSADEAVNSTKQTLESAASKANVSSLPISSTTNQILQQTLLAEQLRNQKDEGLEKTRVTKKQQSSVPNSWWREQHTVFKEFVLGYAQLKNVNGCLGMPVANKDNCSDVHALRNAETLQREHNGKGERDGASGQSDTGLDGKVRDGEREKRSWRVNVLSWKV